MPACLVMEVVLGAPFTGYLLQAPFRAVIDGQLNMNIEPRRPQAPGAVSFKVGGVVLAAPLAVGTTPPQDEEMQALLDDGWRILTTEDRPPQELVFELEPGPEPERPG
jgi:hypothetical protein